MQNHVEPNNKKHLLSSNKHIVFESLGITAITLGVAFLIDEALGEPQNSLADYVVVLEENTAQSHQPSQPQTNPVNNHITQKDHVSEQPNTNPSLLVDVSNYMDTNNLSLKKIQEDLDDLNKEVEQIMRSEKQTDQHDYSITRNDEPAMGKTPPDMIKLPGHNALSNPTEDAQIDLTEQNFSQARSKKDSSHKEASNEEDTASDSSFFNSPLGYLTGAGIAGVGAILGTSLSGDTPPGGSALQTKSTNLIKSGTPSEKNIETTVKNSPQVPQIQTFKSILENRSATQAPDFTLTDVLGDEYSLYESFLNQGKIVVMDFYATWCPHCQTLRDSGLLSSLAEEYGDKVVVITIEAASNSTHEDLIEFFGGSLEGHSELIFEETSLNSTFGLKYFPTLFAISTTGEMLDFGSVRTEFADHHQLYKELVAYEYAYGTVEEPKEDNVAVDLGDGIVPDKVDSDNANLNIQPEPQTMEIFDSVLANSYTQPAPDFTLTDVFGDEYSLYESFLDEGKVAIIDFYATWCPHCQSLRDTGLLSSLAEEYADDVVVITIEAALNSDHDDLIEFFGGSLEGHSELIFEETSLNTTFGLQYFPTLFAVSSTGEMLNFGSARAEFADHHALYQELMAYEDTYGNIEGDKPDNGNAIACDINGESEGCGIPTVSGEWENFPSECGEGILYEGTKTVTDFTLTDIAGNIHTFSEEQVEDTYVLINFFSAGCSHCMEGCEDDTALNQILENHDDVILYHIELDLKTPAEQLEFGFDGYDWSKLHNGVDEFVFNVTDDERTTIMSSYINIEELETCGYPGLYFINSDFEMATIDRDEVSGEELYQLITAHIGPLSTQQNSTEVEVTTKDSDCDIEGGSEDCTISTGSDNANTDVVLYLDNLTDTSIDVVYEAQVPIQAYQFSLTLNGQIDSVTTGAFDLIQFKEQQIGNGEHIALGLSSAGTTLPAGSGTLATISFTADTALALNDFTLGNELIISNQLQVSSSITQIDGNDANLIVEEATEETEVIEVEEPPVDDEVRVTLDKTKNLLWTEYDESTQDLSVYVNLVEQACGFQMNVPGYEILDTGAGLAEDAGYMHTFRDDKVLGYSMTVNAIDPGEGVLTTLNIQPNADHNAAPQLTDVMLVGCDNSFVALSIENLSAQEATPPAVVEEDEPPVTAVVVIEDEAPPVTEVVVIEEEVPPVTEVVVIEDEVPPVTEVVVIEDEAPPVTEVVVIEVEEPPIEIATDADVVLSLNNLTSNSVDIVYESQVPIQAYQFSLALDGQINSITTGAFDIIQFQEQQLGSGEHIALGLSSAGTTLPAGSATLATINFTADTPLVLNDFTLSDEVIISNQLQVSSNIAPVNDNDANLIVEEATEETEVVEVEEPPVDDEVRVTLDKTKNLLWTEYDESTQDLSVYVNLVEQACGFQMNVPGYEILDTGAGFAEDAGYMHTFRDDKVLGYSMTVNAIDAGEGVLTTLNIQPNAEHNAAPQLTDVMLVGCDNSFVALSIENLSAQEATPPAVVEEDEPPVTAVVVIEEEVPPVTAVVVIEDEVPPVTEVVVIEVEEPPIEIATDADVVLSLNNLTSNSVDIVYESQVPIQAYQFSLALDGQINSITTGAFDIIQFQEQQLGSGEHIALGLSSAGTTLPAGSATLATINFTADTPLVLNDFTLSDEVIISNQLQVSSNIAPVNDNDANLIVEQATEETEVVEVEEPPVDDEVRVTLDKTKNLLWTEYDESTQDLSVYVNLVEQACGFQMNVPGYEILDTGAGLAEDAGYMHTFRDDKVLGYSMTVNAIDAGEGVLTTLNIQPNAEHNAAPQLTEVMLVGCDNSFAALSIENLSAQEATPPAITAVVVIEDEVLPVAEVVVIEEVEPPVDDEVRVTLDKTKNLLWTEYDESTQDLSVYVNLVEQACGFQMNVPGYEILDTGAGLAEDAGYMHTFRDDKVLGYSMTVNAIDAGEGVLTTLNIQPNAEHNAAPQLTEVMLVGCDNSFAALSIENLSAQEATPPAITAVVVIEDEVLPVAEVVVIEEVEPPVDDEVRVTLDKTKNLLWTEYDESTQDLSVYVNLVEQACGFQMNVPGYEILDTGAGFAEDAGYMHTFRDDKVLGYSMTVNAIDPGEGVLTTLNIQPNAEHNAAPQLTEVMLVGCDNSFAALSIENLSAQEATPPAITAVVVIEDEVLPVAEVVVIEEVEPPVDDEVRVTLDKTKNLLWTEYDESTQDLSVYVNLVEQACGFQMNVPGYEILDTGAGFAEDAGYMHTFRDDKVLGYSMTVNAIDAGEGVLTTLNIQPNAEHNAAPQLTEVMLVGCDNSFVALSIENLSAQEATPPAVVIKEAVPPVTAVVVIEDEVPPVTEVVVIEVEEPPIEIATDADVVLSLNNLTSNSVDIVYESQVPIQAYQFSLALDGQINSITTGAFDIIQFQEQQLGSGEHIALGLSSAGTALPAGSATLATINFTADTPLVLNDFTLSDEVIISNQLQISSTIAQSGNHVNNNIPDDFEAVLSLGNFTSHSIEVMYETQQPIQAYAFKLALDGQINNAITAEFDNIQILETTPGSNEFYVLGFSNMGATLPLGSHTLARIEFTANSDLQLSDFVLSNETLFANTERLNSTIIEQNNDQEPTKVTPSANTVDTTANYAIVATDAPDELNYFRSLVDAGTQNAPEFKLTDLDGNEVDLYADYLDQGIPVILELFATWCGYCKAFAQSNILADLATVYAEEVQVIMVEASGSSTRADLDTFLANPDYNLQDEIIIESTEINSAYGLQYFPTLFAINTEGEMINWGSVRNSFSTAEDLFEEILAFEAATTVNAAPTTDKAVAVAAATADDAIEINVTINQPSTDSPFYSILSKQQHADGSLGYVLADEPYPTIQPGQAMMDLIENFVAPEEMSPVADHLSSLCELGQACFIMLGDVFTTTSLNASEVTVTNESGQTLLSSDNIEWTPNETINGTHMILTLDEIPTSATTFNFNLTDSVGNGWSNANSGLGEIAGGVWLHHPNGDTELLHLFNEGFEKNLEITLYPEDDDSIF